MENFIRADAWIGFCELIDEFGGDHASVLEASGLTQDDLLPVDRYLPMTRFIDMLNHAVESTGRLDFGLQLGLRRHLSQVGAVGLAMQNGANWRSIVDIGVKVGRIANPLVTARLRPADAEGFEFLWMDDSAAKVPDMQQGMERTVAFTIATAKRLVRPDFVPVAIQFRHARIAPLDDYVAALGIAPTFEQPRTGLLIETKDIDRPILTADPELGGAAMAYLERQNLIAAGDTLRAARLTARSLVELGDASSANLARALGTEVRTLKKLLKDEGTGIESLFDEARRSLVQRLLEDNLHSIAEISDLLGYSSPSTLNRNCNRWFGASPAQIRASSPESAA